MIPQELQVAMFETISEECTTDWLLGRELSDGTSTEKTSLQDWFFFRMKNDLPRRPSQFMPWQWFMQVSGMNGAKMTCDQ